jgi:outer membrane protein assembly factor BamB
MKNNIKQKCAVYICAWALAGVFTAAQAQDSDSSGGRQVGFERLWTRSNTDAAVDACIFNNGSLLLFCADGYIERLAIKNGSIIKRTNAGVRAADIPAVASGKVVVATRDGSIAGIDLSTGSTVWKHDGVASAVSAPTIDGSTVYFGLGGDAPAVVGFTIATGERTFYLPMPAPVISPPRLFRGKLYAGTLGGTLYAIAMPLGTIVDSYATRGEFYRQEIRSSGDNLLIAPGGYHRHIECLSTTKPFSAGQAWSIPFVRPSYLDNATVTPSLFKRPAQRTAMLKRAVSAMTNAPFNEATDFIPTGPVYASSWALDDNTAAIVVREESVPPRALYHLLAVDAVSGKEKFRINRLMMATASPTCPAPVFAGTSVVACIGPNTLVSVNRTSNAIEWEYPLPQGTVESIQRDGEYLTVCTTEGDVTTFRNIKPAVFPQRFALRQNVPNPFRAATTIRYELPYGTRITLDIFDSHGNLVKILERARKPAGYYRVVWNGADSRGRKMAAGVYIFRIRTAVFAKSIRMTMIR